jgi:predicted unusual protein kinase regulating ubiquinone biosynthesis (AarF/ABC1/UbiB family)
MADRDRSLRDELERRLLALGSKLPTSSLGRIGRTALAGLRGGRLAWRSRGQDPVPLDIDTLAALVASVGQLKGVAMKAGQLLSYLDLPLPPELRSALAVLQTHSPAMSFDRVAEVVTRELGANGPLLLEHMDHTPAAAASIGQVHRSTLPDGIHVAVKVQYPDIETAITNDFRSAAVGTGFVGLLVPGSNVDAIVGEARRAILEECDYEREAAYQQRFARIYAEHPTLAVPAVHRPFCSRHVLTTTWVDGVRFDAFLSTNPPQSERDRLGQALFQFYVGTLFQHGLYNWDPHPGNYIVQPDGRLAMLDYGSTREFDRAFVQRLQALTSAVHADDRDALHRSLVEFGMVQEGKAYDYDAARTLLRSFYGPMLRDEVLAIEKGEAMPLRAMLETKRELLKLQLPAQFLFVLRIRFGVMSVLAQLGARANWYKLERHFADPSPGA